MQDYSKYYYIFHSLAFQPAEDDDDHDDDDADDYLVAALSHRGGPGKFMSTLGGTPALAAEVGEKPVATPLCDRRRAITYSCASREALNPNPNPNPKP